MIFARIAAVLLLIILASCERPPGNEVRLVIKYGKIGSEQGGIAPLLRRFEAENPGVKIVEEELPSSSDEQHQFYVVNLGSGSSGIDVFSVDVIWVQEFARAGWLRPLELSGAEDFFAGALNAARFENKYYASPWYIDSGVLYYRKDLLRKYGLQPPSTWNQLVDTATKVMQSEPNLYGYIWQGKQYEGLICNIFEYLWSAGGGLNPAAETIIDTPENVRALELVRQLIHDNKVTPFFVSTLDEESSRNIFANGRALYLRNWPYAWELLLEKGGKDREIGLAPLPSFEGQSGASTLGGWLLAVNSSSRFPAQAEALVRYMTSAAAQKELALASGYRPARRSLYQDQDILNAFPLFKELVPIFERAKPRPVTPYYMMISQVLQPQFSAVVVGAKEPQEALQEAERSLRFVMRIEDKR